MTVLINYRTYILAALGVGAVAAYAAGLLTSQQLLELLGLLFSGSQATLRAAISNSEKKLHAAISDVQQTTEKAIERGA